MLGSKRFTFNKCISAGLLRLYISVLNAVSTVSAKVKVNQELRHLFTVQLTGGVCEKCQSASIFSETNMIRVSIPSYQKVETDGETFTVNIIYLNVNELSPFNCDS